MPPLSRNRRVSRRRANRTLSNYKIATRTSARSQSKQIYALKRQIQRIQRQTKPELVTIQRTGQPIGDFTAGLASWYTQAGTTSMVQSITPQLGPIVNISYGATESSTGVPNNFARLLSFTLYGDIRYSEYTNATSPFTIRIVVLQTKTTRNSLISANDVFSPSNAGNSAFSQVFGPLQVGLSRTARVLSDKRYTLSYQRPSVTIKTRIRYLSNFYRDTANIDSGSETSDATPKGAIFVVYSGYSLSTLMPTMNLMCKLAYSDA